MVKGKRAVGYCLNDECGEAHKGVFIFLYPSNLNPRQKCGRCKNELNIVYEMFTDMDREAWKEVRISFDYSSRANKYLHTFILRDELVTEGAVYEYHTPLVKTERRAEKVAMSLFSRLVINGSLTEPWIHNEDVISLDDSLDVIKSQLNGLLDKWNKSPQLTTKTLIRR